MNGIDIAGHQKGINLAVVPCDFVIIKATQGKTFVNPEFTKQITQALTAGKCVGVYHYANGAGVDVETDHFIDTIRPYIGKVILAIDWENNKDKHGNNDNPKFAAGDYNYCERLLQAVKSKTGITPFLYMSKSVARQFKWEIGRSFPLWVAQYANYNPTAYQLTPWTDKKGYGPWAEPVIFQYSSKGRLAGYSGDLDLDIAYITVSEWQKYAGGEVCATDPEQRPVLRRGDKNEYVRAWQQFLNANGYDCGKTDGIFGDKTEKAVTRWQQAHNIEAGYVGPLTWNTI